MSRRKKTEDDVILVPSSVLADGVQDVLADLRARAAAIGAARPARLDLTDPAPTAFAVQLLTAAAVSLRAAGAFAGYGPTAAAALQTPSSEGDRDVQDRALG